MAAERQARQGAGWIGWLAVGWLVLAGAPGAAAAVAITEPAEGLWSRR
jgi:hypothetical protein